MQDKAKGLQAKHAERINWPIQTTSCVSFPKDTIQIHRSMHEEVRGNDVIKRRYLYCEIYLYKASSMLNERDGARTKKTGLSTNFSLAIVSRKQVCPL